MASWPWLHEQERKGEQIDKKGWENNGLSQTKGEEYYLDKITPSLITLTKLIQLVST